VDQHCTLLVADFAHSTWSWCGVDLKILDSQPPLLELQAIAMVASIKLGYESKKPSPQANAST
jgi:hypothetical protein